MIFSTTALPLVWICLSSSYRLIITCDCGLIRIWWYRTAVNRFSLSSQLDDALNFCHFLFSFRHCWAIYWPLFQYEIVTTTHTTPFETVIVLHFVSSFCVWLLNAKDKWIRVSQFLFIYIVIYNILHLILRLLKIYLPLMPLFNLNLKKEVTFLKKVLD